MRLFSSDVLYSLSIVPHEADLSLLGWIGRVHQLANGLKDLLETGIGLGLQ